MCGFLHTLPPLIIASRRKSTSLSFDKMTCPHVASAHLTPATPTTTVHKEECTQCYDSQDSPQGINVCLTCFNAGCNDLDRNHALVHFRLTDHPLVLNIRRIKKNKPKRSDVDAPPPPKITKLAIVPENDEDMYEYLTKVQCYKCQDMDVERTTGNLPTVIDAIMAAMTYTKRSEVQAWEEEIEPCNHCRDLVQSSLEHPLEPQQLARCADCDHKENLWLCLTCGNLGCGRQQFGGLGGNGHGLKHFETTNHGVCVKLGTITPEGTADIYCYICNESRIDPKLKDHLAHFGIQVAEQRKTAQTITELQLDQNLKYDFSMTNEKGEDLEPLFGPGYTGFRNLGNSCYMASVLQSTFALPTWQQRYYDTATEHIANCRNDPATCYQCQLSKIADGLLSGRYSIMAEGIPDEAGPDGTTTKRSQEGITPAMFKALIGKGHQEFSTMRQQDAYEFWQHFIKTVEQKEHAILGGAADPTRIFKFQTEQRLQCTNCKRVRYTRDVTTSISVGVPAQKKTSAELETEYGPNYESSETKVVKYMPVTFEMCLDTFIADELLEGYNCPGCGNNTIALKSHRFATFPEVLVIHARRFELQNWVPVKLDVPIIIDPNSTINLEKFMGHGQQPGEDLLPEDAPNTAAAPRQEVQYDQAALDQLLSMGFPLVRCQKALLNTGNISADLAMNWLFEHMEDPDIDDPIPVTTAKGVKQVDPAQVAMLMDMGFTDTQAKKALSKTDHNMERAVEWLFNHTDDAMDEDEDNIPSSARSGNSEPVGDATPPVNYNLLSFITHRGTSVHSGHYVAHVKKTGKWTLFNDNMVVLADKLPIEEAYVFYLGRVRD